MTSTITPDKIKQNNKKRIYRYIYDNRKVSQQDICVDLRLSRPTVTAYLTQLEKEGFIEKSGQMDSDVVGRKAAAYCIASACRAAIGVEITENEIKIMALDLYGDRIDRAVAAVPFRNDGSYYQQVCIEILSFIHKLQLTETQILGICFAMQGLVSPDGRTMVYGKILNCTGLSIEEFEKYLPYRCRFIHDSDSAAVAELWADPNLQEAFFLSLSKHIGGSIIRDRRIIIGKHGHSATFEHIPFRPQSTRSAQTKQKRCYCGKYGCIDTICSLHELLHEDEDLDSFFAKKKALDPDALDRWNLFLENLGEVLNLLHLIYDSDLILGGYLAPYLNEDDLSLLYRKIADLTAFPEDDDFLRISKMPKHSITIGGALTFVQEFLMLTEFKQLDH